MLLILLVGEMYLHGHGVASDIKQAEEWFRKGAELEDSDSLFALGEILLYFL